MAITTTIYLSKLEFGNRFDGELYNPHLLKSFKVLKDSGFELVPLGTLCSIKSGTTPKDRDDSLKEGPVLFKTTDVRNNIMSSYDSFYHISDQIHKRMSVTKLKPYDVLLNIVGATLDVIGRTSIIMNDFQEANITQAMTFLRIKRNMQPGFLFAFLNTKYAQDQIKRYARPTGQYNLNLFEVSKILIPQFSKTQQDSIEQLIKKAAEFQSTSRTTIIEAFSLLYKDLKFNHFHIKPQRFYQASFEEVVKERRFNAEYYDPVVKDILQMPAFRNADVLGNLFSIYRGTTPAHYTINGTPVIKTKNVRVPIIDKKRITDYVDEIQGAITTDEGDLILASMGVGSLGRISYITKDDEKCIVDGTLRILRKKVGAPNNIQIPVLLFLSTEIGQRLIYRGISGSTGIISLPDDYLERIPIPQLSKTLCNRLTDLVLKSIESRKESAILLDKAKSMVEGLIETKSSKNYE